MKLPTGAQSLIAAQLGISKQWVSKVLKGERQSPEVTALAQKLATQYADHRRVLLFRLWVNEQSDQTILSFLKSKP